MTLAEQYTDRELIEMKERCLYMITSFKLGKDFTSLWADIYKIALDEINRVLDIRKLRNEGIK